MSFGFVLLAIDMDQVRISLYNGTYFESKLTETRLNWLFRIPRKISNRFFSMPVMIFNNAEFCKL